MFSVALIKVYCKERALTLRLKGPENLEEVSGMEI